MCKEFFAFSQLHPSCVNAILKVTNNDLIYRADWVFAGSKNQIGRDYRRIQEWNSTNRNLLNLWWNQTY